MDNVYDIKYKKKLNFILPMKNKLEGKKYILENKKIVVVIHLHYVESVGFYLNYVEYIPSSIDIIFTVSEPEIKRKLQNSQICRRVNCRIIEKQNRGRDISALLIACREEILKYEYVGFLHDKKQKAEIYKKDTENWIRCLWENMIGSTEYINNVMRTFLENPNLGLLVPPPPISDHFPTFYVNTWYENFSLTQDLARQMFLHCDLDVSKPPITIGTVFWGRTAALKGLLKKEWRYEDFDEEPMRGDGTISHGIERILAYVAQDAGLDTGWVMTDIYAGEQFEYMQSVLTKAFERLEISLGVRYISELYNIDRMLEFVKEYKYIYIYGAGIHGKKCLSILRSENIIPKGFLVSDISGNPKNIEGIPVYSFFDTFLNKNTGIIIAVGEQYQCGILQNIDKKYPDFEGKFVL